MKFHILFTGQNKKPRVFSKTLTILQRLLAENLIHKVLYCTHEDNDTSFIPRSGSFIIEKKRHPAGPRNYLIQTRQLEDGLALVNDNDFVLKTRPDVLIREDLIREIFGTVSSTAVNCRLTGLSNKLWYPWYDATKPFYLADECFAGKAADLKKFISYRDYSLFDGVTHVRRSIEPFLVYESLKDYLKSEYLPELNNKGRIEKVKRYLTNDDYLDYLATYYYILHRYFFILTPPSGIVFRAWSDARDSMIDPELGLSGSLEKITTPLCGKFILGYDNQFLKRINSGYYLDRHSVEISRKIQSYAGQQR